MAEEKTTKAKSVPAKDRTSPRTVLTQGAVFHKDKLHDSVTLSPDGDHQVCSIGDIVMLTDAEFDLHREHGVCLEDYRQAAE